MSPYQLFRGVRGETKCNRSSHRRQYVEGQEEGRQVVETTTEDVSHFGPDL